MIGLNLLGQMGNLGNQMFQYAALKGIARNRGFDYCIPKEGHQLFETFNLNCGVGMIEDKTNYVREKSFNFNQDIFNDCPDDVYLYGYFQNEKYFKHIENEIREDFQFKDNHKTAKINKDKEVISLHVRRGDFLQHQHYHNVLGLDYYEKALKEFPDDCKVMIFSDDIKWCISQDLFKDRRFNFSRNNKFTDMYLMTLCDYHIIANSSFSWWGAWLADSKKVVAPSQWVGEGYKLLDTDGICPNNWVRV